MKFRKNDVSLKQGYSECLWAIFLGCFFYGCGCLLVFSKADVLWVRLLSGFLGVGSITFLPIVYGFCYQNLCRGNIYPEKRCWSQVEHSFAVLGGLVFFLSPLVYLLPWWGIGRFATVWLLFIFFLFCCFHVSLWYGFYGSRRGCG